MTEAATRGDIESRRQGRKISPGQSFHASLIISEVSSEVSRFSHRSRRSAFHPTRPIPVPFVRVGFGASPPIRGVVSDWLPSAETRRSPVMGRTSQTDPAPSFTTSPANGRVWPRSGHSHRITDQAQRVEIISAKELHQRWSDEEKRVLGTVRGGITVTQPRGWTSCSPGIGRAGLPDWLHKRCLRGGDHGKRIEGIQASRFI